jgi:hypothetical protein
LAAAGEAAFQDFARDDDQVACASRQPAARGRRKVKRANLDLA